MLASTEINQDRQRSSKIGESKKTDATWKERENAEDFVGTTVLSNIKVITLETIALAFPVNGMYHCVNAELENYPIQAVAARADKSIDKLINQ